MNFAEQIAARTMYQEVAGWPEYEISTDGQVRRKMPARGATPGKVLKHSFHDFGYPIVELNRPGKRRRVEVHRLVAETFIGPPPTPLHQVAHFDGVCTNCSLHNLRWATPAENDADKERHGTVMLGEKNSQAKLTKNQVIEIRLRRQSGELLTSIASDFGVKFQQVSKIAHRQRWVWV